MLVLNVLVILFCQMLFYNPSRILCIELVNIEITSYLTYIAMSGNSGDLRLIALVDILRGIVSS